VILQSLSFPLLLVLSLLRAPLHCKGSPHKKFKKSLLNLVTMDFVPDLSGLEGNLLQHVRNL